MLWIGEVIEMNLKEFKNGCEKMNGEWSEWGGIRRCDINGTRIEVIAWKDNLFGVQSRTVGENTIESEIRDSSLDNFDLDVDLRKDTDMMKLENKNQESIKLIKER